MHTRGMNNAYMHISYDTSTLRSRKTSSVLHKDVPGRSEYIHIQYVYIMRHSEYFTTVCHTIHYTELLSAIGQKMRACHEVLRERPTLIRPKFTDTKKFCFPKLYNLCEQLQKRIGFC